MTGKAILVVHDWGSALGFDWAMRHPDRVAGIAYMEAIVRERRWSDFPPGCDPAFRMLRSPAGEQKVLEQNYFIETILPKSIIRLLGEEEMAQYRAPFLTPGISRLPTLVWPRELPIEGEPADVIAIVEAYGRWLAQSPIPKLFINAEPGAILIGAAREFCRTCEPDRNHRAGHPFHSGRRAGRDRPGGRSVRARRPRQRGVERTARGRFPAQDLAQKALQPLRPGLLEQLLRRAGFDDLAAGP